jgi:hypothetical protein
MSFLLIPVLCLIAAILAADASMAGITSTLLAATATSHESKVDEQLYSRQIFVYGKSAQQSLSASKVVIRGSNVHLVAEIVKNLALAGVGHLLIESDGSPRGGLCGGATFAEYAHSLNPLIQVSRSQFSSFS